MLRKTASMIVALAILPALGFGATVAKRKAKGKTSVATKPTEPPTEIAAPPPKEALLAAADEIIRQVVALRGLSAKKPLQRGVLSRQEIGDKLKERIGKEYTPAEVQNEARVLKRLGLIPQNANYEQLILDLLMEQVAGFYDPFSARLYIADWLPLEMQRPALAHEIEHALQDQHFDLKRFATPIKDNSDEQLAQSALVEGDGTEVMLEFQAQQSGVSADKIPEIVAAMSKLMLQASSFGQAPLFDKAPIYLKETLLFPYMSGLKFVAALREASSEKINRVDTAFKAPPDSTEQILHPEKFLNREAPVKIVAPEAKVGDRLLPNEIRRDVLGELQLKILFSSAMSSSDAEKAAEGWGGDRLVAYAPPAGEDAKRSITIVDLSSWDSENDAREAERAGKKLLAKLGHKNDEIDPGIFRDSDESEWSVERSGDRVLLIFGAPKGVRAELSERVWKSWKVGDQPAK